ncbi:Hypothetical predicted protein [Olea europaea subsp. europaea]|uniref:GIY-YIG domain-containing protein n=1 Tax=Olea europaea subsp. europaea TaxID=158383 RepID=A0A8S0UK11_OLEEU|nr:Hypothetical predicted protein [Olea europaea subsp. europaea]
MVPNSLIFQRSDFISPQIMSRATPLSKTFRSLKSHSRFKPIAINSSNPQKSSQSPSQILASLSDKPSSSSNSRSRRSWTVYLILSSNPPVKTYVGVTYNFSRRLKQHNGELKGGAKASRAGRPWICACLVQGFRNKSKGNYLTQSHLNIMECYILVMNIYLSFSKRNRKFRSLGYLKICIFL